MPDLRFTIRGNAFHTPRRGSLETLPDCLVDVMDDGTIGRVTPACHPDRAGHLAAVEAGGRCLTLAANQYMLPGLVDLHVHAPQWPQLGKALDEPLEVWLQRCTFPLEARYSDTDFAREVYGALVSALLSQGTTTAVYFATTHVEATVILAETCLRYGQRALVGRVAMDHPDECPTFYRDSDANSAIRQTREVIDRIRAMQPRDRPLVLPAITPRFLPSCTDELLAGLGVLACETGCHVQTHCSESDWEVAHVADRFGCTDAEALDRFGLLTRHAILAHGNFVTPDDRARIRTRGAGIAHCPLSNFYFAGAVAPVRKALDEGLNIGLGTDISGGPSPFLLDSARMAMAASRALDTGTDPTRAPAARGMRGSVITASEAFWLATRGGGEALGLPIGSFERGYAFDAIVIEAGRPGSGLSVWPDLDTAEDVFEKIVRCATADDIVAVWVDGVQVSGAETGSSGPHQMESIL